MPFNMFPYTDLHDINLDWILNTLKAAAEGSVTALEQIKAMENLLKPGAVRNIVRDILDEMAAAGDLGADVLAAVAGILTFNSYDHGWSIQAVRDRLTMAKRIAKTFLFHDFSGGLRSDEMILPLDMPVDRDHSAFVLDIEAYNMSPVNVDINPEGTRAYFRLLSNNTNLTDGDDALIACQCSITGRKKQLRETPVNPSTDAGVKQEIKDICDSYYSQAALNWGYGNNFVTNLNSTTVTNDGKLMMECDALVALVMLGIPFEDSPYNAGVASFNFADLVVNPQGYTWPLPWASDLILNRKVTWTGGQNWWLWDQDAVFSRQSAAETGDIVIFQKPGVNTMFDYISHIGICSKEGSDLWVYHFTGSGLAPGSHMKKELLSTIMDRESYPADHVYFARPVYSAV